MRVIVLHACLGYSITGAGQGEANEPVDESYVCLVRLDPSVATIVKCLAGKETRVGISRICRLTCMGDSCYWKLSS